MGKLLNIKKKYNQYNPQVENNKFTDLSKTVFFTAVITKKKNTILQ